MKRKSQSRFTQFFEKLSARITRASGKPAAFLLAFVVIIFWAATGPFFGFSNTWQLVINTGTSLITFLMVFIIQQSQNKDTAAIQLKLNELIAASPLTSNRLIDIEDLTAEELDIIRKFYVKLAELAKKESNIHKTHSLDEAAASHSHKKGGH